MLAVLHDELASGCLLSCCVEDFSLPAASEATEERGDRRRKTIVCPTSRFVLPTFFTGDGQANRLPRLPRLPRPAASLGLGCQGDNAIRSLLNRDSRGWRGRSWRRAHLWVIGTRGG